MADCKRCGAELPPGATVCEYCGSAAAPEESAFGGQARPLGWEKARGELVRFKRSSVIGMFFCAVFTMLFYPAVWYALRLSSIKKLDPARYGYARWIIAGFAAAYVLWLCVVYDAFALPGPRGVRDMIFYAWAFLCVCSSFTVRAMLRGYAERVSPGNPVNEYIAPSWLWTFAFGIFYLQSQINRMIDARLLERKI